MLARVLTKRDEPRLALALTVASALVLLLTVLDDIYSLHLHWLRPPGFGTYLAVACLLALGGGLAPWIVWRKRGDVRRVTCSPGVVRAGSLVIHAGEVTALRVAAGARGRSVAIRRGKNVVFVEVERAEEAQRIMKALGVSVPFGELALQPATRGLAVLQAFVTAFALPFAALYFVSAAMTPVVADGKTLFGMGGLSAVFVSLVVLVARSLSPRTAVAVSAASWDAHVALHVDGKHDEELHAAATSDLTAPRPTSLLGRGEEPAAAWLARLDALPAEQHAYRGDAMREETLREILSDAGAPVDTRMGAARILKLRFGEPEESLVRVVDEHEVRVRVEAALHEHEDAEEHLERLGPLFRAR